jgi:hypothetical protein
LADFITITAGSNFRYRQSVPVSRLAIIVRVILSLRSTQAICSVWIDPLNFGQSPPELDQGNQEVSPAAGVN